jgi:hypothetical protein
MRQKIIGGLIPSYHKTSRFNRKAAKTEQVFCPQITLIKISKICAAIYGAICGPLMKCWKEWA